MNCWIYCANFWESLWNFTLEKLENGDLALPGNGMLLRKNLLQSRGPRGGMGQADLSFTEAPPRFVSHVCTGSGTTHNLHTFTCLSFQGQRAGDAIGEAVPWGLNGVTCGRGYPSSRARFQVTEEPRVPSRIFVCLCARVCDLQAP